jgi:hypothetical protein
VVEYVDHTGKVDDDGSYSRGASSKLADTDVQWHIKAAVPPSRTSIGRIVATRKKDRTSTVPATVRYMIGGDGTGAIRAGLEDTFHTAEVTVKSADRKYIDALAAGGNTGKTWAEWFAATGVAERTFSDARKRLIASGAVIQQGDLYFVSPAVHLSSGPAPQASQPPVVR